MNKYFNQIKEKFPNDKICEEVCKNISIRDIKMLWYIKNSRFGDEAIFHMAAKKNYEAYQIKRSLYKNLTDKN